MKRDPYEITTTLLTELSLLDPNTSYNINEIRTLKGIDLHWLTVQKYLKMISLIQKYTPRIEIEESNIIIKDAPIFERMTIKERLCLYLFNQKAIDQENSVELPVIYRTQEIYESKGVLFEETVNQEYFLTEAGLDLYRSLKQDIIDLIFNEKEISERFPEEINDSYDTEFAVSFESKVVTTVNRYTIKMQQNSSTTMSKESDPTNSIRVPNEKDIAEMITQND